MIFHRAKKLCIFLPPKTGTKTAREFLVKYGWNVTREYHIPPQEAVAKYPNLANYQYFAFIRNPVDRFVSCIKFLQQNKISREKMQSVLDANNVQELTYDAVVSLFDQFNTEFETMFFPQANWFCLENTTALDFDNLPNELIKLADYPDMPSDQIPVLNKSEEFGDGVITDNVRNFVREYYAVDYQLAKDRLGKEYA